MAKAEPTVIETHLERPPTIAPRLISVAAAAAALAIGVTECKVLISRGELPSVKIGARRLVAVRDLDEFVTRLRKEPTR